jgi:hypothetical protein
VERVAGPGIFRPVAANHQDRDQDNDQTLALAHSKLQA